MQNLGSVKHDKLGILNITKNGDTVDINGEILFSYLDKIRSARTIDRSKYYIQRLIKYIAEEKTGKINDINLNRWKEYDDIITDSLWVLERRDNSGVHSAEYWGNFIPQIPNQLLRRYTKKNEWVLDPFAGSGTTLIEARRLQRNSVGIEINPQVADMALGKLQKDRTIFSENYCAEIIVGDSASLNIKNMLKKLGIDSVQFVIFHPPYWDIIKFSGNKNDLSNCETLDDFLKKFGYILDNSLSVLDSGRYFAIVIGDKYSRGEWIPLGFYVMQEVLKRRHILKSIIVKNFEDTRGKRNQKELWRYRALVGGFYVFKHEYILLFKKGNKG
ncbi:DNA methyltransferase [bacterium]|nr:DNA methyltransferase [bacterium]